MRARDSLAGILLLACAAVLLAVPAVGAEVAVTADYDNGHISTKFKGVKQEGDAATIDFGDYNPNRESWFNFKITGCKDKTVTFIEKDANPGPAFHVVTYKPTTSAFDNAYEMTEAPVKGVWKHTFREDTAYVMFAYPATNGMVDDYMGKIRENPSVEVRSLGKSSLFGLDIPMLVITDKGVPDKGKKVVFLVSREDSYEAGGTLMLLGAVRYLLSDDAMAREIRKKFIYVVVPILSRDGAKIGATNWPLQKDNGNYLYLPPEWRDNAKGIKELDALKGFFRKWKEDGKTIDEFHSLHCAPYFQCWFYFRPNPADPNAGPRLQGYLDSLRKRCFPHYGVAKYPPGEKYMFQWLQEEFPGAVGCNLHADAVFNPTMGRRPVEDMFQDGELLVRASGEYFGMAIPKETPPFLFASGASATRCKKGDQVKFHAFYRDVLGREGDVRLVLNGKRYGMEGKMLKDGMECECTVTIESDVNDYYVEASNGVGKRRVPDGYLQPGPYLPVDKAADAGQ
jgi:hypothetical protein